MQTLTISPLIKRIDIFFELAKPRLSALVLTSTLVGFYLGAWQTPPFRIWMHTFLGTALLVCGANTLNQLIEKDADRVMKRTAGRPLPTKRIAQRTAWQFGVFTSVLGLLELAVFAGWKTAILGSVAFGCYICLYTPLKKKTSLSALVGGISGALPPLMGWTAAGGRLDLGGWTLFSILFLWQLPHFLAIAWRYRDDYDRAGLAVLPVEDRGGQTTGWFMILYCTALLPVSLMPTLIGLTGVLYFYGALMLGICYLGFSIHSALQTNVGSVRRLFLMSLVYLPTLFLLMVVDKH